MASLAALPRVATLAVIINCGTKWSTTLTLAAARECTPFPVLLIDCESKDGSREHFARLSRETGMQFWWLDWPLRPHGVALDALFTAVQAEQVLLIDSDLEIRSAAIVESMTDALHTDRRAYGSGFLHGPTWLGAEHGVAPGVGYYAQRMWVPLVLLRTAIVRAAIDHGASFAQRRAFRQIAGMPRLSRWWAYRHWIPGIRRSSRVANAGRGGPHEPAPAFVEYDTGAEIHQTLNGLGHRFAAVEIDNRGSDVNHYHGVTRAAVSGPWRRIARRLGLLGARNGTPEVAISMAIRDRLAARYGIRSG